MTRCVLLKYGELILKGLNKHYFEERLLDAVREKLEGLGEFEITALQSTVTLVPSDDSLIEPAFERMKRVFGIVSVCVAYMVEKSPKAIEDAVRTVIAPTLAPYSTFKCEAKRSDKRFGLTSPEICALCGAACLEAVPGLKVDVHEPQVTLTVEIRDHFAFIHAGSERGAGGMPRGTAGKVLLLLSGGIDSPVAGHMMARRGATVEAVHFESYPYTSLQAREKVLKLAGIMARYTSSMKVHVVSVTDIQLAIRDNCREEYFTLILRRFMMKIARRLAWDYGCSALVTGESLGQVASQTLSAIAATDSACDIPVFRPLIGMDKEEIIVRARKLGTFDTSILPYEDCCTVFTPRHPKLVVERDKLLAEESKLDSDALIKAALARRDTVVCREEQ